VVAISPSIDVSVLLLPAFLKYRSLYQCSGALGTESFVMDCWKAYDRAHTKKIKSLCQSIFAILEQSVDLPLVEQLLNLAAALMRLQKGMNSVEGPIRLFA
jgi:hypothetical protein